MAKSFTPNQWTKIMNLFESSSADFGLPDRRDNSVVIGTFNIRKLGPLEKRSAGAREFLIKVAERFDLLAIQEVMDDLEGIKSLKTALGDDYGMVVSDVTGTFPGDSGSPERLAFLFNWKRIKRTELASDITYDRSKVAATLFDNRTAYSKAFMDHAKKMKRWEEKCEAAKAAGKRKPSKPQFVLPTFLTFIRQPHCASFEIVGRNNEPNIGFLAVNAHLLYGTNAKERRWEFDALVDWLTRRAKKADLMYHENMILLGDCNFEFDDVNETREDLDARLKKLNSTVLKSKKAAKVNFPLLTEHPQRGLLRTNARLEQTYDQIGIFAHDERLPKADANDTAGTNGADGYDYGVHSFTDLFATALENKPFCELPKSKRDALIKKFEHDVSDHLPAWFRLQVPGRGE